MIRIDKDTMVDGMSVGMIIDSQAMEEEVDSLGIATPHRVDPFSASHVIKRVISTQTVHTRTELISNSVLTVG